MYSSHPIEYVILFVSKNSCPRVLTHTCNSVCISKTKQHLFVCEYEHLGTLIFTNKAVKYNKKDSAAIRKHCYQHEHNGRLDDFKVLGNAVSNFHLQLKILKILKMKPSLNIARESILLYLFDNDYKARELNSDLRTQ